MADELAAKETSGDNVAVTTELKSPVKTEPIANGKSVANGEPASNGCSSESMEEIRKEATKLLLQGKRHLVIRDYTSAVASLAEACKLFTQVYDEKADEMAEPYFYYGKALFEVARNEANVLDDQGDKGDDEDEEDEDDDEQDEGEDEETVGEGNEKEKEKEKDKGKGDKVEESAVEESEAGSEEAKSQVLSCFVSTTETTSVTLVSQSDAADSEKMETETEVDENVNDLQLSWEYFELAKLIYLRKADTCPETAIKLADVYLHLGENGLESESYDTAINDIKACLELQKKHLPEDDRRIAQSYYQLGIANSLTEGFNDAKGHFKSAIRQLEKKLATLNKKKETGDKKTEEEERDKDAFYTIEGEIKEIESVISDIKDKISDMDEYKSEMKAEILKQVSETVGSDGASTSSSNNTTSLDNISSAPTSKDKPVTDISHLVRKKRKNEDEEKVTPEKKPKVEN